MKNVIYLLMAMVFCLGFCRCTDDDDDEVYPRNQILGEYTGTSQAYLLKDGKIGEKELWYKDITATITPMEKIDANFIMKIDENSKYQYSINCNGYKHTSLSATFTVENQEFTLNGEKYIYTGNEIKVEKFETCDGVFMIGTEKIEMSIAMRKKDAGKDELPIVVKYSLTKK